MTTGDQMTDLEQRVARAAVTGELVDLCVGVADRAGPAHGATWDVTRTVRAELLIDLLTAEPKPDTPRPRAINIRGARISGPFDLEALALACPLMLRGCHIEEPMNLNEATAPAIRLPGCHLPGLTAVQLRTKGNVELNDRFCSEGEVNLVGAHIGGSLDLDAAHLINPAGYALRAEGLAVEQSMLCRSGFIAEGEVNLEEAHIGASLQFNGAHLINPAGYALRADGLTVGQYMIFWEKFIAEGEVRLFGTRIGRNLNFVGARLTNAGGRALNAQGLSVEQNAFFRDGFVAEGEVDLVAAHIGGQLSFSGARLTNANGRALNAYRLRVDGDLTLRPERSPIGAVVLTSAHVGVFYDDPETWPATLSLRGFTYETLGTDHVKVRVRLRSLARQPGGYVPQPYDQLAAAYRRAGQVEAARQVAVAKQWRRRGSLNPMNWLLYITIGYGYRPWLAAIWLAGLTMLGTRVFSRAHTDHLFHAAQNAPAFHPVAYTLDTLLPIVDLGQQRAWTPIGWALYWSWVLIGAGWVLTTAVVAGLSGIFKRD
jgi:hypothetical protein